MSKIYYTIGLPGSGKSTWAIKQVETNPLTMRANRDDIRYTLWGKYWYPKGEKLVTIVQREIVFAGISQGYDVIVDDTNLNPKTVKTLQSWADISASELVAVSFTDVSVDICIERDKLRTKSVGEKVIREMAAKYGL